MNVCVFSLFCYHVFFFFLFLGWVHELLRDLGFVQRGYRSAKSDLLSIWGRNKNTIYKNDELMNMTVEIETFDKWTMD